MTLLDHYFSFCAQVCEGACPTPAGITLTREDAMERIIERKRPAPPSAQVVPPQVPAGTSGKNRGRSYDF